MDPGQTPTRTPKVIKRGGIHYTPQDLGGFLANQALKLASKGRVRVLDPACGDGSLLEAVAREAGGREVHLCGLDTDPDAVKGAIARLRRYTGGRVSFEVQQADFVEEILATHQGVSRLFGPEHASGPVANPFDVVIANPPYVRTQVLGSAVSRNLATDFGLSGRVDLYHAFVVGMALALRDGGVLSLLCSNRFMTTRSGSDLRRILASQFQIQHLYDLGDTKLFSAAVLPAIVLATRSTGKTQEFEMTSIYELKSAAGSCQPAASVVEALKDGRTSPISVGGRSFGMRNGRVRVDTWDKPWVAPSEGGSEILEGLAARTCMRFQDVARVRVGIKTTSDPVFIRRDWEALPVDVRPDDELLLPLLTHHIAGRWAAQRPTHRVLYPYDLESDRRKPLELENFQRTRAYLNAHQEILSSRKYVTDSGRFWWEIWVPQRPFWWRFPKIVFPDISEEPKFWLDTSGAIVNGDCYWLPLRPNSDIGFLMLGVANSSLATLYYDETCGNRLYAGRRRYISQYVDNFPLPDPESPESLKVIRLVKTLIECEPQVQRSDLESEVDYLVWRAFGLEQPAR